MRGFCVALLAFAAACGSSPSSAPDGGGGDLSCAPSLLRASGRKDVDAVLWPSAHQVLAFGGDTAPFNPAGATTYQLIPDFWKLDVDCGAWSRVTDANSPGPRAGYAAAFDTLRNRMIIFGGRAGSTMNPPINNEVWAFDPAASAWSALAPTGTPPSARVGHGAVYDPDGDRLIVFGGDASTQFAGAVTGDTWALAFGGGADGAWTQLNASGAAGAPSPRQDSAIALDPTRKLVAIWGGAFDFTTYTDEVWTLDLTTGLWKKLANAGVVPSARFRTRMIYDAARDRFVLFGGHDPFGLGLQNETDAFTLDAGVTTATFANLVPGDADLQTVDHNSPERRDRHSLIAAGDTLWTFWGSSDCGPLDDVWTLDLTAASSWTPSLNAMVGETCIRRAQPNQTCPSDCANPL